MALGTEVEIGEINEITDVDGNTASPASDDRLEQLRASFDPVDADDSITAGGATDSVTLEIGGRPNVTIQAMNIVAGGDLNVETSPDGATWWPHELFTNTGTSAFFEQIPYMSDQYVRVIAASGFDGDVRISASR